jgi:hypothetical protein
MTKTFCKLRDNIDQKKSLGHFVKVKVLHLSYISRFAALLYVLLKIMLPYTQYILLITSIVMQSKVALVHSYRRVQLVPFDGSYKTELGVISQINMVKKNIYLSSGN